MKIEFNKILTYVIGFIILYALGELIYPGRSNCIGKSKFYHINCYYEGWLKVYSIRYYIPYRWRILIVVILFSIALVYLYFVYDELERNSLSTFSQKVSKTRRENKNDEILVIP